MGALLTLIEVDDLSPESKEDRIKGLETQNITIRERLSKIEGLLSRPNEEKRSVNPILVAVVSIVGTAIVLYLGWLGNEVVKQGKQISKLQTILAPEVIEDAAKHPDNADSAKVAARLIKTAVNEKKKLDPSLISEAGTSFAQASTQNSDAWNAALGFLNYKSALFISEPSLPPADTSGQFDTHYVDEGVPDRPSIKLSSFGVVPKSEAAQLNHIGTDLNSHLTQGNALLLGEGGATRLDNMQLKNVILKDVEIHYSGGPIKLTNVYFVNCKFVMDSQTNSIEFAKAIFASGASVYYTSA